jgi:hypothetical protein
MLDAPNLQGLAVGRHRLADGSAVWKCWRCNASGGTRRGHEYRAFASSSAPRRMVSDVEVSRDAATRAASIWKVTKPLSGSPGADYLELRHCVLPPADGDLRFHPHLYCPETKTDLPALVAKVTTVEGNRAIGIHRVWFKPGEPKAVKKMRLGGSGEVVCIRLWPDDTVTMALGIAEGIETALAAGGMFKPMWATIDAGQMAKFPILTGIESLTIFADYDKAGLDAARTTWRRYRHAGINANLLRPQRVGEDVNDMVIRAEAQA